jgi:hypothetical protein
MPYFKINFKSITQSAPASPKRSHIFTFSVRKFERILSPSYECYMARQSHTFLFDHPNVIYWRARVNSQNLDMWFLLEKRKETSDYWKTRVNGNIILKLLLLCIISYGTLSFGLHTAVFVMFFRRQHWLAARYGKLWIQHSLDFFSLPPLDPICALRAFRNNTCMHHVTLHNSNAWLSGVK